MTVDDCFGGAIASGFKESEISGLVRHVNHQLECDCDVADRIPLSASNLFHACMDGLILW